MTVRAVLVMLILPTPPAVRCYCDGSRPAQCSPSSAHTAHVARGPSLLPFCCCVSNVRILFVFSVSGASGCFRTSPSCVRPCVSETPSFLTSTQLVSPVVPCPLQCYSHACSCVCLLVPACACVCVQLARRMTRVCLWSTRCITSHPIQQRMSSSTSTSLVRTWWLVSVLRAPHPLLCTLIV